MADISAKKAFTIFSALIVWLALLIQFKVSLKLANGDYVATIKLLLSFFTILTNLLVAICFTVVSFLPKRRIGIFFSKTSTTTALTVYILVVAIIYNLLLRGLLSPVGWARVSDELLHVVSPLIFLVFWVFFVEKSGLRYSSAIRWLIYPMLYIFFILIRGYFVHNYPYPFIDVVTLGYTKALINASMIVIFFWLLSLLLIFIGKKFPGAKERTLR